MSRGGKRTGAGRPRSDSPRKRRSLRLDAELDAAIESWGERFGAADFTAAIEALVRLGLERE